MQNQEVTERAHRTLLVEHGHATAEPDEGVLPEGPHPLHTATWNRDESEPGEGGRRGYRLPPGALTFRLAEQDSRGTTARSCGERSAHGGRPLASTDPARAPRRVAALLAGAVFTPQTSADAPASTCLGCPSPNLPKPIWRGCEACTGFHAGCAR